MRLKLLEVLIAAVYRDAVAGVGKERRRNVLALEQKLEICNLLAAGTSCSVGCEWCGIGSSSISDLVLIGSTK